MGQKRPFLMLFTQNERVRLKCEEVEFIQKEKAKNLKQSGFIQNGFCMRYDSVYLIKLDNQ